MLELLDDDLQAGLLDLRRRAMRCSSARARSRGGWDGWQPTCSTCRRIDAQVELRSEPVELGELSRAVLAEFELGIAERRIVTSLDDGGGIGVGAGRSRQRRPDPADPARQRGPRQPRRAARSRSSFATAREASLSVCDHGPGVPPEEQQLIFERFKRGRRDRRPGRLRARAGDRARARRRGWAASWRWTPMTGRARASRSGCPAARAPEEEPVAVG